MLAIVESLCNQLVFVVTCKHTELIKIFKKCHQQSNSTSLYHTLYMCIRPESITLLNWDHAKVLMFKYCTKSKTAIFVHYQTLQTLMCLSYLSTRARPCRIMSHTWSSSSLLPSTDRWNSSNSISTSTVCQTADRNNRYSTLYIKYYTATKYKSLQCRLETITFLLESWAVTE